MPSSEPGFVTEEILIPHGSARYRSIPQHPGYAIGDDGSVWSCWSRGKNGLAGGWIQSFNWKQLSLFVDHLGYHHITLRGTSTPRRYQVGRLVLGSFVGPCPNQCECRHLDNNPSNNHLWNLQWSTHKDNCGDKEIHGTAQKGSRHGAAKLTEAQVLLIRELYAAGSGQQELADRFGVSCNIIGKAAAGRTWKHVGGRLTKIGVPAGIRKKRSAKLDDQRVREIRALYKTGCFSHSRLGHAFKINATAIHKVITRKAWKHVP